MYQPRHLFVKLFGASVASNGSFADCRERNHGHRVFRNSVARELA